MTMPMVEVVLFLLSTVAAVSASVHDKEVVTGSSVNLSCDLIHHGTSPQFWLLNETSHEIGSVPNDFPHITFSFSSLAIKKVTEDLHNTVVTCGAHANDNGWILGSQIRIIVKESNSRSHLRKARSSTMTSALPFDYRVLANEGDSVTVGWTYDRENFCSDIFELQGFLLQSDETFTSFSVLEVNGTGVTSISSSSLVNGSEPVYYRIVAIQNGEICSDMDSQINYYNFNELRTVETRFVTPNSTVCYNLPETELCQTLHFVLPEEEETFICAIANSNTGTILFGLCPRDDNAVPRLSIPRNGVLCFSEIVNDIIFHFQCNLIICGENCFVFTPISSQRIIIADPPSEPSISFNGTSLCVVSPQYDEAPVNFTVEVTDMTGLPVNFTTTPNTRGPECLSVTSDSGIPNFCLPINISVVAVNIAGTNSSQRVIGNADDCECYLRREEVSVMVSSVYTNSATVELSCGRNEFDEVSYMLQSDTETFTLRLACGERTNVENIRPNTEFEVTRNFSSATCSVLTFTTPSLSTPPSSTSNRAQSTVGEVPLLMSLVAIIAFLI